MIGSWLRHMVVMFVRVIKLLLDDEKAAELASESFYGIIEPVALCRRVFLKVELLR